MWTACGNRWGQPCGQLTYRRRIIRLRKTRLLKKDQLRKTTKKLDVKQIGEPMGLASVETAQEQDA